MPRSKRQPRGATLPMPAPSASAEAAAPAEADLGTTSLPKEQRLKKIWRKQERKEMVCQWPPCSFTTKSVQKFHKHVETHVPVFLDPGTVHERCCWADCKFHSRDEREMRRHVLYHGYHGKLMALGASMARRNALRECTLDSSERHVLPDLPDSFLCCWEDCDVEFDDAQSFFWHVEHHVICHYKGEKITSKEPGKCLWRGCSALLTSYYRLQDHMHVHTAEKVMACPNCGIMFSTNRKLAEHLHRQTPIEELRYQCNHCMKLFPTGQVLRDHIRNHINHVRCQQCSMTLPNPYAMRLHVLFKHKNERNFPCTKCEKRFKTAQYLEDHLKRHRAVESGVRLNCPHEGCRFIFIDQERLQKHVNKVHSSLPRSYYFCHLCDARFMTSGGLTNHLKKFHSLAVPQGHSRFSYRRHTDGHFRLQTLRYESLEVAQQTPTAPAAAGPAPPASGPAGQPDVLALSCQEGDVPDTITGDDGRELHLPEQVRSALTTGRRVLVCVVGDQVQLLARMEAMDELRDPDDPDALMMVVDGQAVADGPAAAGAD